MTDTAQILLFKPKEAAKIEQNETRYLEPDEVKNRVIHAAIGVSKLWDNGAFALEPIWDNDGYWQDAEFDELSKAVGEAFSYAHVFTRHLDTA